MLLDEPLCNLDANLREEMRFEIKQMQVNTGVTILYVTHDQEVALAISDRIAIMDQKGCIRQIGVPESVFETPVDSYVFQFMGVSNFMPGARRREICGKGDCRGLCYESGGRTAEGGRVPVGKIELTRVRSGKGEGAKECPSRGTHRIPHRVAGHEIRVQQDPERSPRASSSKKAGPAVSDLMT